MCCIVTMHMEKKMKISKGAAIGCLKSKCLNFFLMLIAAFVFMYIYIFELLSLPLSCSLYPILSYPIYVSTQTLKLFIYVHEYIFPSTSPKGLSAGSLYLCICLSVCLFLCLPFFPLMQRSICISVCKQSKL